ncbi:MAG: Ig-like domain-containing protein, partial [Prevotella sp.]|nr:Ig-like domain-containing protein [Prevotella sp.]
MRTKILTLFFTLMSVLSVKAGNSIYIDEVTALAGDIITLSVQMTNTEADKYCGFQFDVVLPEGVSFVQNDGFYEAELSTQRTTARKTNFFDSVLLSDGSLRILCNTSASNSEVGHLYCFSGTSGEVCTIKVKVDENIKAGKHSIVLKNIALSDYSSVSHAVSDYTMELKVPSIEVTSVSLNKATLEMVEGDTENLTATVMPANATEQGVTWTSSNGNVATVDAQGKVTAVAEGTAIITVTSVNGKTAQCNVVVAKKPNPVTSITLNKTTLNITEGDSETLTVTYAPDDADDRSVTWTSSNGNVATVDAQGKVTAVAEGTAIITATSVNGKTAQCAVVVSKKANPVTAIALNKTTLRLTEGENETLSVTYTPADADGRSVTWTTSNGNVATVDAQGKVTAVAEGTAIITATSVNGKTAQCVVIVEKDTENISFADSNVKTICIENWDTNGDGELSKTEAAAVSSLGEVFRDNKVITS